MSETDKTAEGAALTPAEKSAWMREIERVAQATNCARCEKPGPYQYLCEECMAEDARERAEEYEYGAMRCPPRE
jgi:hypothetical protein